MNDYVVPLTVSVLLIALCLYLHFRALRMGASRISEIENNIRYPMLVVMMMIFMLVAGIEALTGLLLIAWSASFTYLTMERIWTPQKN